MPRFLPKTITSNGVGSADQRLQRADPALDVDAVARDEQQAGPQARQPAAHHDEHRAFGAAVLEHPQREHGDDDRLDEHGEDHERIRQLMAQIHLRDHEHRAPVTNKRAEVHGYASDQAHVGILQRGLADDDPADLQSCQQREHVRHRLRAAGRLDQQHLPLLVLLHGERVHERQRPQAVQHLLGQPEHLHFDHVQVPHVGLEAAGRIQRNDAALVDDRDAVREQSASNM